MNRKLIVYKVEYRNRSGPWDYHDRKKFVKTKRIVMTADEVNQTDGYWQNHSKVRRKFKKQMGDKYYIDRINKA